MSTQLTLEPGLSPRRLVRHLVLRGPRIVPEIIPLAYEWKPASIMESPLEIQERKEARVTGYTAHLCGLCRRYVWCWNVGRCTLGLKSPCSACEETVAASYAAGRYAVAR